MCIRYVPISSCTMIFSSDIILAASRITTLFPVTPFRYSIRISFNVGSDGCISLSETERVPRILSARFTISRNGLGMKIFIFSLRKIPYGYITGGQMNLHLILKVWRHGHERYYKTPQVHIFICLI